MELWSMYVVFPQPQIHLTRACHLFFPLRLIAQSCDSTSLTALFFYRLAGLMAISPSLLPALLRSYDLLYRISLASSPTAKDSSPNLPPSRSPSKPTI